MMKAFRDGGTVIAICVVVAGCNPLNLTPQQQANLDRYIQAGKITVKAAAGFYCVFEPTTTQIIRVFDPSKGTAAGTGKIDNATQIACQAAYNAQLLGVTP